MTATKTKRPKKAPATIAAKTKLTTHCVLILDQSGSMRSRRDFAVTSYNEIAAQCRLNAKDQDITVSLLTFNGDVFEHMWLKPADELVASTADDYKCDGSTALHDAVGYAIEKLQATTAKDDPNTAYLIQVITDGDENSSKMYSSHNPLQMGAFRKLTQAVQETGRWTITFMGCDASYLQKLSQETMIPVANMGSFSLNNLAAASGSATVGTAKYLRSRSTEGTRATCNFYSGQNDVPADYATADAGAIAKEIKTSGGILLESLQAAMVQNCTNAFIGNKGVDWVAMRNTITASQSPQVAHGV